MLIAIYYSMRRNNMINTKNSQAGRSMIEMLGVLAIIGVLSVGGIAGYSKAMTKFKINKSIDQISQIVGNIRTMYGSQKNYNNFYCYPGSDCTIIKKAHIVPDEMWNTAGTTLENPFGGNVLLGNQSKKAGANDHKAFDILYDGLPEEACMELATYDWGSGSSSGFLAIGIPWISIDGTFSGCTGLKSASQVIACPNGSTVSVPMPVDIAATICNCSSSDSCSIGWKFY